MARYGPQFGPDITFLGVPRCTWDEPETYADADVVILGAPFDGGTSHRPGTRFGPQHIRQTCYLPHDGSRPSLALRVDGLSGDLTVYDAGDVEMFSGDAERSVRDLQRAVHTVTAAGAVPLVLGGDHTVAWPDAAGRRPAPRAGPRLDDPLRRARRHGDIEFGSLVGHGQPMRRLIESGSAARRPVPADRAARLLAGPETLAWMAAQGMRSYEMTEIVARGLDECLTEAFATATDDCDGRLPVGRHRRLRPGHAPGTGTPEPGRADCAQTARRRAPDRLRPAGRRRGRRRGLPPYDHADITVAVGEPRVLGGALGDGRPAAPRRGTGSPPWDPAAAAARRPLSSHAAGHWSSGERARRW
jgi:agmatinase